MPLYRIVSRSLMLLLLAQVGCGGAKRVETAPVSGSVKFKGAPVADANVVFLPKTGPRATGTTDASGSFRLMTMVPDDGAVPGEHIVLVEKSEPLVPSDPYSKRKPIIPLPFSNPQETPHRQKVVAGEKNEFVIDLN